MKKILGSGILACVLLISSSFSSHPSNCREVRQAKNEDFKIIAVTVHSTVGIPFTGCSLTINETVYIDFTPGQPPKIVKYDQPTFGFTCRRGTITGSLATLDLDEDGHVAKIGYDLTGDSDADAALSDSGNLDIIKADINQAIDDASRN